jgi:hypothetical protein
MITAIYVMPDMGAVYKVEDGVLLCTPMLLCEPGNVCFENTEDAWSEIAFGLLDEDDERELLTRFGHLIDTPAGCPTKERS